MTRSLPLTGALAVAVYAAVAVLSIAVWYPMAAVPGASHAEIVANIESSGDSYATFVIVLVATFTPGVVAAGVLAVASGLGRMRWSTAVAWQLGLLLCGAPTYFWASFPLGIAVADAFFVSGGIHQPAPYVLYAVSVLAGVALVVGGLAALLRRRAPEAVTA